jgi:hypothetical protein
MWRQAITPDAHRPKKGESHDNIITSQGTSRAYTLDRLQRERPDLFAEVVAKRLSANAAAIEAGFDTSRPFRRCAGFPGASVATCWPNMKGLHVRPETAGRQVMQAQHERCRNFLQLQ